MNVTDWIRKITPTRFEALLCDLNRFRNLSRPSSGEERSSGSTLRLTRYRVVRRTLGFAGAAAERGDLTYAHFLHGVAAAFYGLTRLAEAMELEATLGPALGLCERSERQPDTSVQQAAAPQTEGKRFDLNHLCEFFDAEGVHFLADHDKGILVAGFGGECGPIQLFGRVSMESNLFGLRFRLPLAVPAERRPAMATGVALANYGMPVGSFELDLSDGEVAFKIGLPTDDTIITQNQLNHCMAAGCFWIDRYSPAFQEIAFTDASPEEAIAAVEE